MNELIHPVCEPAIFRSRGAYRRREAKDVLKRYQVQHLSTSVNGRRQSVGQIAKQLRLTTAQVYRLR